MNPRSILSNFWGSLHFDTPSFGSFSGNFGRIYGCNRGGYDNCVNVPADMLQNTPFCRNNCERKTQNFLESIKIRHNFASEIRNDIAL